MFESFADTPIFPVSTNAPEDISINNVYISFEKTYDEYGNLCGLKWKSGTRARIALSSAIVLPIFRGSFIFRPDIDIDSVPSSVSGYAYDIERSKCWEYDGDKWVEQPGIVSPSISDTVATFGSSESSTKIQVTNFRGDIVYEEIADGLTFELEVNDELSAILRPGSYYLNIFNVHNNIVTPVSRVSLSILE